jgi:hypothetical protein
MPVLTTLEKVKMRIRTKVTATDDELTDLISAAKKDMELSGISAFAIDETDVLILDAIALYCKARYGISNPDSDKYLAMYQSALSKLASASDYNV